MTNRRKFITSLVCTVAGLSAIKELPTVKKARKDTLEWYLTQEFIAMSKGKATGKYPRYIYSGKAMFEAYKSGLQSLQRFVTKDVQVPAKPALAFKTARYRWTDKLGPWDLKMSFEPIKEYEGGVV